MPVDGPSGFLGGTATCNIDTNEGRRADYFYMYIDSDESWYMGTQDAPKNDPDLWSMFTHEMGHATGWRPHLDDNAYTELCDNNSEQHTMCKHQLPGTERKRTLAPHDKDTYRNAYP